jgi:hypothetical protein
MTQLASRKLMGEEPRALVLALSGHAALNDVQRVGVSIVSTFTRAGAEWIATTPNLWVFAGVRRQPKMGGELHRRDSGVHPRTPKRHWGSSGRRFKSCQPDREKVT